MVAHLSKHSGSFVMPQGNTVSALLISAAYLKHDYLTLKNQPESLIFEAIALTSMDNSSVKLTGVVQPNKLA